MKITLVGSGVVSIPPKRGGATELIIYELSKFLSKQGHDVTVFDLKEKNNKNAEIIEGAHYKRFWIPKFNNVFLLRFSELLFGVEAFIKARKNGSDIVHCQTVFSALPFAIFRLFGPKKIVYTSHNPAWTVDKNDMFNNIILKIEEFVVKRFNCVITVSGTMKKKMITRAKTKNIHTIYNFVDVKRFSPHGKGWKTRMKIKGPIVLFVGKLSENKGVEYFLRAAKIIIQKSPDVMFVLVGPMNFEYDGKNKWIDIAKKLGIRNNVIFTGAISDKDLPSVYSSADVFCFPTLKEAFGIVVIEAMASGLPVITTDLPVLREITNNSAIFVKPKDYNQMAQEIFNIIRMPQKIKKASKKSIVTSRIFEKSKIMKEYEEFYEQLLVGD